jgi:RHS repeat-associated protein
MIRLHAALVCQEHVAHEDDGGMGDQSIEITALNFLGKFQGNYGDVVDKSDLNIDAPDHIHAVSSVVRKGQTHAYDYDANGNQTAGPDLTDPVAAPVRTLTFNADNMPTQVVHPQGGTINLTYDGNSQRAKKAGPTGTTYYFSNHFEIVDNSEICYVFAGNQRVAMVKDHTSTAYFHKDHLGSSTVLTRTDGTMIESARYMPFGGQRGSGGISTTAYKFTDQELDGETGLYNYDARLYDPVVGRFVSADPYFSPNWSMHKFYNSLINSSKMMDGYIFRYMENDLEQYFRNPQNLDRYAYVKNDPLNYIDPNGEFATVAGGMVGGAIAGGIAGAISGAIGAAVTGGGWSAIAQSAAVGGVTGAAVGAVVGGLAGAGIVGPAALAASDFAAGLNVGIGAQGGGWAAFFGGLFGQAGSVIVDPTPATGNSGSNTGTGCGGTGSNLDC